jgi:hypothetical protein
MRNKARENWNYSIESVNKFYRHFLRITDTFGFPCSSFHWALARSFSSSLFEVAGAKSSWLVSVIISRKKKEVNKMNLRRCQSSLEVSNIGTTLAHYTNGNVLRFKEKLGHKSILSTMKYIRMIHFEENEFEVATATTMEEAKQILSAGFDYVTEKCGIMLSRRPQRLSFMQDKCRNTRINNY